MAPSRGTKRATACLSYFVGPHVEGQAEAPVGNGGPIHYLISAAALNADKLDLFDRRTSG